MAKRKRIRIKGSWDRSLKGSGFTFSERVQAASLAKGTRPDSAALVALAINVRAKRKG